MPSYYRLMLPPTASPRRVRAFTAALALCAALGLLAPRASAQPGAPDPLDAALEAYQSADFDTALRLLSAVKADTSVEVRRRARALQYLGRVYVAKNELDGARASLTELLLLEPPLFEPDPDRETPPFVQLYYDVRQHVTGGYAVERADPGLQVLAIADFTNNSIDRHDYYEPFSRGLASMMINYMSGATDLKVVERERLAWVTQEQDLQRDASRVDQATAVRIGKLLGVQAVLFGSYVVFNNRLNVSVRLVKVETGEILLAEQLDSRPDKFFEAIEQLSLQAARAINVQLDRTAVNARTETRSLDAMMSYSEGLGLIEEKKYPEAYAKFVEALNYDANYERARIKAESLRPMLQG